MSSRFVWIVVAIVGAGLILLIVNDSSGETFGIANGSFGSALYLGAWGALLAAGILGSGMRFGDIARNLALWLFIILAFVAAYQYRYELQDVAHRMSGGLVAASPLSATDADGRATITLDKALNGHFEARGAINGKAINLLVDTGASTTVLTSADAARIGFDPSALSFTIPVSTANGTARAARVVADDIAIGPIVRRNVPLLVAEAGRLDQSLLGMNFIGTLSGFDLRGHRLILRD